MEQELHRALQRVEPSAGFADRVLARLPEPGSSPAVHPRWASNTRWWLGAGLAASIVAASAASWMELERRAEAEQARQDVELALRIASEKLQLVQSKVRDHVISYRDRYFQREQS